MKPFFVSLILFIARVWDAVTDPLVGYLVSRSGRTPIGKLLPWWVERWIKGFLKAFMEPTIRCSCRRTGILVLVLPGLHYVIPVFCVSQVCFVHATGHSVVHPPLVHPTRCTQLVSWCALVPHHQLSLPDSNECMTFSTSLYHQFDP